MEMDFIDAVLELVFIQQRLVHPAIGIGIAFADMVGVLAMHEQQIEPHAARRLAVHRIQYVRGQASNTRHKLLSLSFPCPADYRKFVTFQGGAARFFTNWSTFVALASRPPAVKLRQRQ
jgi:hypothetical protein